MTPGAAATIAACVYCAPILICCLRGHPNVLAIAALNLLTGWTFVGWTIALVWSLKHFDPALEWLPREPKRPKPIRRRRGLELVADNDRDPPAPNAPRDPAA
jgi:hypothetical protein